MHWRTLTFLLAAIVVVHELSVGASGGEVVFIVFHDWKEREEGEREHALALSRRPGVTGGDEGRYRLALLPCRPEARVWPPQTKAPLLLEGRGMGRKEKKNPTLLSRIKEAGDSSRW